jgi:hypothetical protein
MRFSVDTILTEIKETMSSKIDNASISKTRTFAVEKYFRQKNAKYPSSPYFEPKKGY